MNLPDDFLAALEEEVGRQPGEALLAATQRLSLSYRARHGREYGAFVQGEADACAYAAYRLPATFAALKAVFEEVHARQPGAEPATFLDVGAGPGTALWAAREVWPSLRHACLLEPNPDMIRLGSRLIEHSASPLMRDAEWRKATVPLPEDDRRFDVVVAGYMMGEVAEKDRARLVSWLWSSTRHTLAIVEPGTPRGFEIVRAARTWLLEQHAHMVAPCPHDSDCPMSDGDWCHFSERLARNSLHRHAKRAALSYEDEKYSYVAVSRATNEQIAGRVVRHPQVRPGHIYLQVCAPGGLERRVVTRKDRGGFRRARNVRWGDALFDMQESDG